MDSGTSQSKPVAKSGGSFTIALLLAIIAVLVMALVFRSPGQSVSTGSPVPEMTANSATVSTPTQMPKRVRVPSNESPRIGSVARCASEVAATSVYAIDRFEKYTLANDRVGKEEMLAKGQAVWLTGEDVFKILSMKPDWWSRNGSSIVFEVRFLDGPLQRQIGWIRTRESDIEALVALPDD